MGRRYHLFNLAIAFLFCYHARLNLRGTRQECQTLVSRDPSGGNGDVNNTNEQRLLNPSWLMMGMISSGVC